MVTGVQTCALPISVAIEGNQVGVTPFTGKIARKRESVALVSKPGYASQPITLTTAFNPVTIISIVCWDLGTTDCLTGACWEYSPNSYYVNMRPAASSLKEFQRDSQIKAFAMTYRGDISVELVAGFGSKISALHSSFFSDVAQDDFLKMLRAIDTECLSSVEFGERLASNATR
jgi:hypothetical protein